MPIIRLVRSVDAPDGHGPRNGMFVLQQRLRASCPPWLRVGGELQYGEIPWFWCWLDAPLVTAFGQQNWPFIAGPNVLFADYLQPGIWPHERAVLDATSCLLQFTESEWYEDLIRENCTSNHAPIVRWSYPIEPRPEGPSPVPEYDVLLYHKMGEAGPPLTVPVIKRWKCIAFYYGDFHREDLIAAARRSRCCLYLSTNDRGPLAAAEIALAGCPLVSTEMGCPWVTNPGLGVEVRRFCRADKGIEQALTMNRDAVRAAAVEQFATERTVETILGALEPIATDFQGE